MAKRRSNGDGSFRKLANGTYEYSRMLGYHADGRRKIKSVYGKTKSECQKKMSAYLRDIEAGLNIDNSLTLEQWAETVMALHNKTIKPVTVENYRYTLRIINSHLGNRKIADIKPIDIDAFLLKLRDEGRSDSAISQCRGLLYLVLDRAEGNCLIRRNPVRFAQKLRKRPPKEKETFTIEEIQTLMSQLPHDRIGLSIRLLLATGLRTQEILALRPENIAEDGSYIDIKQAVSMSKGTVTISTPKSFDSCRRVYVPENIRYCAIELRNTDSPYIWSIGQSDLPCNPSTFRKYYKQALESVPNVRYLSPHSCRHTYVTVLQSLGVDISTIQAQVGHSTALMTTNYLHVHDEVKANAAAKLSAILPEHKLE